MPEFVQIMRFRTADFDTLNQAHPSVPVRHRRAIDVHQRGART